MEYTLKNHVNRIVDGYIKEFGEILDGLGVIKAKDVFDYKNTRVNDFMDSLDIVEFVMEIEEKYEIYVDDSEFTSKQLPTLAKMASLVFNERSSKEQRYNRSSQSRNRSNIERLNKPEARVVPYTSPIVPSDRQEEVFAAILSERQYQDNLWNESTTDSEGQHTPTEWLVFIQHYLAQANAEASTQGEPAASKGVMDNIRKIGAMCVAAMEQNEIVKR